MKTDLRPECRHLMVFAGVPCAGKSYLLAALEQGSALQLGKAIGLLHGEPLEILNSRDNSGVDLRGHGQVLLHVDIFARQTDEDRQALGRMAAQARQVTFVTVAARAAALRQRHDARLRAFVRSLASPSTWRTGRVPYRIRRHAALFRLCRDAQGLRDVYRRWHVFVKGTCSRHWIVDGSDGALNFGAADDAETILRLLSDP
jgi:hypothetical protein